MLRFQFGINKPYAIFQNANQRINKPVNPPVLKNQYRKYGRQSHSRQTRFD